MAIRSGDWKARIPLQKTSVQSAQSVPENALLCIKNLSPTQFHWPDIDADIEIEALESPETFPLIWK
jgi:hypothetical protein